MSPDDTAPSKKKKLSGAQYRKKRVERGLPRFSTPAQETAKRESDKRRGQINIKRRRDFAAQIKLERGCADCGYNKHADALEFDHLPGTKKVMSVAALCAYATSKEAILAEIAKCEVVCANCHRIRTAERKRQ